MDRDMGVKRLQSATREKMILILLLITMISCVCAGTLVVNVTQTNYQAEENDNITLEWTFTPRRDKSPNLLFIICELITDHRVSVVYRLHHGVKVLESQDEPFSGRVKCDRDVLREGRLRLHVSRLRTEDSGQYKCLVQTKSDLSSDHCWLNVTATVAQEQHTTPTVNPEPKCQERFYILLGAGIMFIVIVIVVIVYSIAVATAIAPEAAVL
ncbi:adipose-secreted signaling protein isoform X1 [Limanda limanda]|uniref:adipose-secreted signaling protein isoform X1 n=1 Tax=Limanda limanda TaxID=27771 RepID=UPI0029C824FB|nr:adipose-secreted signaling protein isoform X1 [Limanda limanda]